VASSIGIKIANGEFYSIIEENSQVKKRLVLTTVHNKQQSVQIDLYRSSAGTMADAFYVGSLVLENITPKPKGEPSIELVISSDSSGNITADAVDLDASGERQTLNVSLKSMDEENLGADLPDFEFEKDERIPKGLYERPDESSEEKGKKGFPWLLVILAALVLTAVALLLWIFFFQGKNPVSALKKPAAPVSQSRPAEPAASTAQTTAPATQGAAQTTQSAAAPAAQTTQSVAAPAAQGASQTTQSSTPAAQSTTQTTQPSAPAAQTTTSPAQTTTAPAQTTATPAQAATAPAAQTPPPVIQSPAQAPASAASANRQRSTAPVASYNVPSVIPRDGVPYVVRYGDTLWDIADAFYRNPWLYTRIALFNNIRNPDLIISGTTIIVPPRN
jgi:LysM repeat protein